MRVPAVTALAAVIVLAAAPAQAAGLKRGYAICRDKTTLRHLLTASEAEDGKAFDSLMRRACRPTLGGEAVRVATRSGGVAKIAVKGRRGSWWTVVEALE